MLKAGHEWSALGSHGGHAAQAHTADGRTVIGVMPRNDDVPVRLSLGAPVEAGEADQSVDRLGTRAVEEDVCEVAAEHAGDLGGEVHRGWRRGLEERVVVGKLDHLVVGDPRQLLAPVTHLDAP